jgi:hypothetical protein
MLSSGPGSAEFRHQSKEFSKIMLNSQSQTGTYAAAILRSPKLLHSMMELAVHLRLKSQISNILDIGREILKMFPDIPMLPLGKLATKEEPNKVRVFAMVDPITQ